jgi:riboflavin synthase
MFTGLIEAVGRVSELKGSGTGMRLRVETPLAGELAPGDSLAVNGVCLTATVAQGGEVHADVGPETARITTLGSLVPGRAVNLERPMRGDGRFGGHFVQGHVDGTGVVTEVRTEGDAHWLTIGFDPAFAPLLVRKGSIAVDGISLTVAGLDDRQFDVMIIPFTWQATNLSGLRAGDRVNLEFDMVGKYVARAAELAQYK